MGSLSTIQWIILVCFLWMLSRGARIFIKDFKKGLTGEDPSKMICPSCGTQGDPATITRGSIWIEIILWLCLIVPGLIYSLWRLSTRDDVCGACGQKNLIPVNSPNGKRLAKQFETN